MEFYLVAANQKVEKPYLNVPGIPITLPMRSRKSDAQVRKTFHRVHSATEGTVLIGKRNKYPL